MSLETQADHSHKLRVYVDIIMTKTTSLLLSQTVGKFRKDCANEGKHDQKEE